PADARAHRIAAVGDRPRARPADVQARRPAERANARTACRQHAAGGADRRPHAQPRRRRAPVLLRAGAARAADLEILDLMLECLRVAGIEDVVVDLADARIVRGVLAGVAVDAARLEAVYAALAAKDTVELRTLSAGFPAPARQGLEALVGLYG